jgi:hypothetical protein
MIRSGEARLDGPGVRGVDPWHLNRLSICSVQPVRSRAASGSGPTRGIPATDALLVAELSFTMLQRRQTGETLDKWVRELCVEMEETALR